MNVLSEEQKQLAADNVANVHRLLNGWWLSGFIAKHG